MRRAVCAAAAVALSACALAPAASAEGLRLTEAGNPGAVPHQPFDLGTRTQLDTWVLAYGSLELFDECRSVAPRGAVHPEATLTGVQEVRVADQLATHLVHKPLDQI